MILENREAASPGSVRRQLAADVTALGLRERHKISKLQRISTAAITLFGRDGYDGTTLRDIAREADVAVGTLSLYASDKRDLVLLIFNALIPPLFELGRADVAAENGLVRNMTAYFAPCYRAYAGNVTLYRVVLGQIYNGPNSVHAEESDAIRMEVLGNMAYILRLAIAQGEVRSDLDIDIQSRAFFYLYFTAVRVWLFQDDPDPAAGLEALSALYAQLVRGAATGT